jgi:hypothetical protein
MQGKLRIRSNKRTSSLESESISSLSFRRTLLKAYDNLPVGGRMVISKIPEHLVGESDLRVGVGGKYSVFLRPVERGSFTFEDYLNWVEEAGFTQIFRGPHPYSLSILVAVK